MLKLSVGYQYREELPFSQIVTRYADSIGEVYFAWVDQTSGRSMLGGYDGYLDYGLQGTLLEELRTVRALGIRLNLLFNANCYGAEAMSQVLQGRVCSVIDYLTDQGLAPEAVTTTSPAIAHMIRQQYPGIERKASVNMRIGTVKGMEYVAHLFDSFCVAKECNRDLERLEQLYTWAEEHGKRIAILANSGCMRDCSGQIFHDNLVAHEAEAASRKNIAFLPYMCWNYLKEPEHFVSVLQNTWIRPEDIHHYEGLTHTVKLATRSHSLPGMVIGAYAREKYSGNLLDLFEPGFGPALAPYVIDSMKLPADFWEKTTACRKDCQSCTYCAQVLKQAMVRNG